MIMERWSRFWIIRSMFVVVKIVCKFRFYIDVVWCDVIRNFKRWGVPQTNSLTNVPIEN